MWEILMYAGGGLIACIMVTLWYQTRSRQYRPAIRMKILVRERKGVLFPWRWYFNKSEEDHLNRLKNRLVSIRAEQGRLLKEIPVEEARLKDAKEFISANSEGHGLVVRDVWSPRREPVVLKQDVKIPKHKTPQPKKQKPLLELHQAN